MKEVINNLVALAKEYASYCSDAPLQSHIRLRGEYGDDRISVYFANDGDFSVDFGGVVVMEFGGGKIEFPWTYGKDDLRRVYDDAKHFLDTKKEELNTKMEKARAEKLKELKSELKRLQSQELEEAAV